MIKVALCDDIIDYNKKMESYIEKYGNENHVEVKITSYGSGSQLLLNYQKRKFDVIFLDVSMPEMDGFETAEEIRKSDTDVSIVFCTSYYTITNAGKGFEVAAEDFLSKPLLYRKVENILNKIYKKKLLNAEEKLFLKCHDGLITLQLSDIIYIQTENKLLILHTIHGDVQSSQRMSELEKRLSKKQFFRCHNSYMVNFDYMMEMVDAIRDCAKGAAIATRTEVEERQLDEVIKDVRNDKKLVQYVRKNMDFIGEEYIERDLTQGIGSTDVGNVTHEIPAIQFYVKLKEHVGTHTKEFAVAAGGEEGKRNLHASVQLLAMSALDVLSE